MRGDLNGRASVYVLGSNTTPGTTLSYSVDTIPTLNHDLFSMTEFYDACGYDVVLKHEGFSGLTKTLENGDELRIPVTYDPFSFRWLLHYVIATDAKSAKIAGERLESQIKRQTASNMRRAAQASLIDDPETICAFLQTIGGDLEIFEGDQ